MPSPFEPVRSSLNEGRGILDAPLIQMRRVFTPSGIMVALLPLLLFVFWCWLIMPGPQLGSWLFLILGVIECIGVLSAIGFDRFSLRTDANGIRVVRGFYTKSVTWGDVAEYAIGPGEAEDAAETCLRLYSRQTEVILQIRIPEEVMLEFLEEWNCLEAFLSKNFQRRLQPAVDAPSYRRMEQSIRQMNSGVSAGSARLKLLPGPPGNVSSSQAAIGWIGTFIVIAILGKEWRLLYITIPAFPFWVWVAWNNHKLEATPDGLRLFTFFRNQYLPWSTMTAIRFSPQLLQIRYQDVGRIKQIRLPLSGYGKPEVEELRLFFLAQSANRGIELKHGDFEDEWASD